MMEANKRNFYYMLDEKTGEMEARGNESEWRRYRGKKMKTFDISMEVHLIELNNNPSPSQQNKKGKGKGKPNTL